MPHVPPRVLHVSDTLLGGLGSFLDTLVPRQLEGGLDVAVAVPSGPIADRLRAGGAEHHAWSAASRPGPSLPRDVGALGRIVAATRPDVVHLHNDMAGMAGRLLLRGRRPTLFQPHAWVFVAIPGAVGRATLAWERLAARWTSAVVCVGEEERRIAAEAGIRAPLVLARNGLDLERWRAYDDADRRTARARLGIDPLAPLAVCVGRLHRQKGQHRLLDAWPAVREAVPAAEVVLVGDGPDRAEIERRGVAGVRLVGLRRDVPDWLAAADVVAQPSRWEGLSLTVLEALASARSVVATDVPGMRELVRDGAGALVAAEDPAALAAALVTRLRDRAAADREGRAGRGLVEARHDLRAQVATIGRTYEDLLAGRYPAAA